MAEQIIINQLTTMDELYQVQKVEEAVWQMSPNPVHQTYTAMNNGGVILGAFDESKMIGFLYSFAGFDGKQPYLCSHMMGILPEYRKDGLGERIKLKQFEVARSMGYSMITWTYDPLESMNAYLNLHKIQATGAFYKKNYYGEMTDQLNRGLQTDRFQVLWDLNKQKTSSKIQFDTSRLLIKLNENGSPAPNFSIFNADIDSWFVPIPENFQTFKQTDIELAKKWRQLTGDVFELLFTEGYTANDLLRDQSRKISFYYFSKS